MKVLVADQFEQSGLDGLRAAGCEVIHEPACRTTALAAALAETRRGGARRPVDKVTAAMLDAGKLSLIVRAGAGYNTIDVATRRRAASTSRTARARTRSRWPSWRSA